MSSRRLARAKQSPSYGLTGSDDPGYCAPYVVEHPRYSKVTVRIQGREPVSIKWQTAAYGQNRFNRASPRFESLLSELGLSQQ